MSQIRYETVELTDENCMVIYSRPDRPGMWGVYLPEVSYKVAYEVTEAMNAQVIT